MTYYYFVTFLTGYRSLESKWQQVSSTFLSIQADLNTVVVWMVSILRLISTSSHLLSEHLGTVSSTSTTIGIAVIFMFYSFFSFWQHPSIYEKKKNIYIYISILKSVYLGSKLLFRQVLLKTMEHCLLCLIFQVFLWFFLGRDPGGKEIVLYLQPKRFRPHFWSSSGVVCLSWQCEFL